MVFHCRTNAFCRMSLTVFFHRCEHRAHAEPSWGFASAFSFRICQEWLDQVEFVLCDEEATTMLANMRNLFLLGLILSFANLLHAQGGANGTILGTVTDPAGAVLSNARVDVTNIATNVTNQTQTTSSGDFTLPFLPPGTYRITVEAPGFQKSVTNSVTLVVGQEARVNVAMKPGAVSETVEVQASAVSLDTDSSAISQIVTQRQVDQLPLNGLREPEFVQFRYYRIPPSSSDSTTTSGHPLSARENAAGSFQRNRCC